MPVYASSRALCREIKHIRYASRGMSGSGIARRVQSQRSARALWMRYSSSKSEVCLTFLFRHSDQKTHPKHELGSSDDYKPNHDGNAFHGHGIYPMTIFSEISSESLNIRRNPPSGQHRLCKEGRNNESKEGDPR